jgi:phosphatidylserine/phosphatidylglycerophosphate/cardiolipin synthase-like enzyme
MYEGIFHSEKKTHFDNKNTNLIDNLEVYFSPQDKSITDAVLPLIQNAKEYIYIPTFVLTEKRVTEELVKAKNRGVDVKIIMDALNASIKHSKHKDLRANGIMVKTENYAGKMHSKSMIIDDEYTIIGSMNFSNSGENKNDENLIVIKDSDITKFYKNFFLYQWNKIDNTWLAKNVRAEGKDSIGSCFDGIDNNYDGLIDFNDPACK